MSGPGKKTGQPIDKALYLDLRKFCRSVLRKMGIFDLEDQTELVDDTLCDLGIAIGLNSLSSLDPPVLAAWCLTCATRKAIRWKELQKRVAVHEIDFEPTRVIDGVSQVLAREQIRKIGQETIMEIIDLKYDPTKTKQERRRAKYLHERVVKIFKPGPKKAVKKKLSRSHWRAKQEKLAKKKK